MVLLIYMTKSTSEGKDLFELIFRGLAHHVGKLWGQKSAASGYIAYTVKKQREKNAVFSSSHSA